MGRDRAAIREVEAPLTAYLDRLGRGLRIEAAVVFGSRARNEGYVDSDLDLAVVSSDFEGTHRIERIGLLLEDWHGPVGLEPLGFTPAELLGCPGPLVWSLLHEGVAILDTGIFARAREKLRQHIDEGRLTPTPRGWQEGPNLAEGGSTGRH